jgi:hypothetical protein
MQEYCFTFSPVSSTTTKTLCYKLTEKQKVICLQTTTTTGAATAAATT